MLQQILIGLATFSGAGLFLFAWYQRWKQHARRYDQSGYTPPPTAFLVELVFNSFTRLYAFLTVGPVKTVRGTLEEMHDGRFVFHNTRENEDGRLVFIANHQVPADFALVRHVAGRHFRTLTSANELKGATPFAVGSAATGVISVAYNNKDDGAKAVEASIKALSEDYFRVEPTLARILLVGSFIAGLVALHFSAYAALGIASLIFVFASCAPASEQGFTIFPQGALLPDDPEMEENFRPGAVRIATAVAVAKGDENVKIVPIAIVLKRNKKSMHWSHHFLAKMRSSFFSLRRPSSQPVFKISEEQLDAMSEDDRNAVFAERDRVNAAYKKSRAPIYGAVVVRGNAIKRSELPHDDIEAMSVLRDRVRVLYEVGAAL